jgi:acetyl esterase/lipase
MFLIMSNITPTSAARILVFAVPVFSLWVTAPFLVAETPKASQPTVSAQPPQTPPPAPTAKAAPVEPEYNPAPTQANVSYGSHPKQVMHFWKAATDRPAPLLFFVHGGGWQGGNRGSGLYPALLNEMLSKGISVVSVEYRFIAESTADGVTQIGRASCRERV